MQLGNLARHALRRTCARLCHVNGGELDPIPSWSRVRAYHRTVSRLPAESGETVNDRFGYLCSRTAVVLRYAQLATAGPSRFLARSRLPVTDPRDQRYGR